MKQTLLLMVLTLVMCSINVSAQQKKRTPVKETTTTANPATPTTSKEYNVGEDGFEWYKVKRGVNGETRYGAEDRYGNMIVPTEYDYMFYLSNDNPLLAGFMPAKGEYMAWYSKSGKCVVPYTRGYTWIHKWDEDPFGTYYTFKKPDGGGILDRNGKEVTFVKVDSLTGIYIFNFTLYGETHYFLKFHTKKGSGLADVYGTIFYEPDYKEISAAEQLELSPFMSTTNPLAGNGHETLAEAEGRSSSSSSSSSSSASSSNSSSSNNNSGNKTSTIVVEHHRQPVPMQEWQQCTSCWGSGNCRNCAGSGTTYIGSNLHRCSMCGGRGRCTTCSGQGGRNVTVYR